MSQTAHSRAQRALHLLPRLLLAGGIIGWLLGWSLAGVVALSAAAYLWLDFWVRAIRFRRAREHPAGSRPIVPDPSAPSRFGMRVLYRERKLGPLGIKADRFLARHPFLSMGAYFGSISFLLCSLGLLAGVNASDVLGFGVMLSAFGTLLGGGVIWLTENKPDTADGLARALSQENVKGGPPPL